jgi:hypothetical protein
VDAGSLAARQRAVMSPEFYLLRVQMRAKELLMKPTIVPVHGAFAESSSWDGVIDRRLDEE